jgi:hypothetical protein
MFVTVMVV